MLKPSEKKLNIILETNEILRIDKQAQSNYYATMLSNGIMSINEIRRELGFNPIEDGDKHVIPFTDLQQNQIGGNENNEEKPNDIE